MADKIKKTLNDDNIAALKAAPKGKRYDAWDVTVPGLSVRVTDSGAKTYCVTGKLPNEATARRFTMERVGIRPLDDIHDVAREWLRLISKGKDPRIVVRAAEATIVKEATADAENMFRSILTQFLAHKKQNVSRDFHQQLEAYLNTHCLPLWGDRQIGTITTKEMSQLVRRIASTRKGAAKALLTAIKTLFAWAASNGYTVGSAASIIVFADTVGTKGVRDRPLSVSELKAVWDGAVQLSAQFCAIIRMLILTGCRLNEVVDAKWSEIDLRGKLWTIPKERMKMGEKHVIPLTDMMIEVLLSVPRGAGDCVFSINDGRSPNKFQSKAKSLINTASGVKNWVTHDLRHTMRTMCSPLGIRNHIAEEMIAHAQPGVQGIYDHHEYLDEKGEGFRLWNAEVARIVGWERKVIKLAA
jgi:integrase